MLCDPIGVLLPLAAPQQRNTVREAENEASDDSEGKQTRRFLVITHGSKINRRCALCSHRCRSHNGTSHPAAPQSHGSQVSCRRRRREGSGGGGSAWSFRVRQTFTIASTGAPLWLAAVVQGGRDGLQHHGGPKFRKARCRKWMEEKRQIVQKDKILKSGYNLKKISVFPFPPEPPNADL